MRIPNVGRIQFVALAVSVFGIAVASADDHGSSRQPDKVLYVWASDQARVAPDFLAVVDFDERSADYGRVMRTVPVPPPGNVGNEAHHCHLSADERILGCGGLLSVLRGQNGIFFFDVSDKYHPRFLFSTAAAQSSITDDFLPLREGGFLVTQMGSASGGEPGRVAEFDRSLLHVGSHFGSTTRIHEWPDEPPLDGFNPHGISARPDLDLMVTADFIRPDTTLNLVPGDPVLRGSVRVWDFASRTIVKTVTVDGALGTMDVKFIPRDPDGLAVTAGMFDGHVYVVDPMAGTASMVFDCETVTPHFEVPVRGGMAQLIAMPRSGDRLLFGLFQAGQVGMLDITDRTQFTQVAVVSFGVDTGPHNLYLTDDDKRLVVVDYFLNEDSFGKIHFEGDHKIHVIRVGHDSLALDRRFDLDFNTLFPTGLARPHGVASK